MTTRFEAALQYAARGWPILALHTVQPDGACGCGSSKPCSAGKHPRWRHGLKDATTEVRRIRLWGARWEHSNIGIRTGVESGLLVLDVDPRHGGDQTLGALEKAHGPLCSEIESLTGGGGRHIYFAHPGGHVGSTCARLGPGLDTRGDGGYVVAPPSGHPQGSYRWKVPPDGRQPSPAPAWLLAQMGVKEVKGHTASMGATAPMGPKAAKVPEGQRNQRMFSLAGALRGQGMDQSMIETILQAVNTHWLEAPLPLSELGALARSITRYPPGANDGEAILTRLSDVAPSAVDWLWPGRIPLGKLSLVIGDPGLGKSLVTVDMAARVSTGKDWPDAATPQKSAADVVLLAAEDDLADTVRPRMDEAGGDSQRVHVLTAVQRRKTTRPFNLTEDLDKLRGVMRAAPNTRLVIIDPITAYLGEAETKSNSEIRSILTPLSALASELSIAVVAVSHLRKSGGKAIYRALGSLAFTAAARAVWGVAKDPDQEQRQVLVPVKMNIGPQPTGLAYTIQDGPLVHWHPEAIQATADGVFGDAGSTSVVNQAVKYLTEKLTEGPRLAAEIEAQALAAGISRASLKRGRRILSVQSRKNDAGRWTLSLPRRQGKQESPTKEEQEPTLFDCTPDS